MAVFGDSEELINTGMYQLAALVSGNESDNSVTLAKKVEKGQRLCWAIRDAAAAQFNLKQTANQLASILPAKPDFGLIFSCLGRGPYFYGGVDRDLALLRQMFPRMPFIAFMVMAKSPRSMASTNCCSIRQCSGCFPGRPNNGFIQSQPRPGSAVLFRHLGQVQAAAAVVAP